MPIQTRAQREGREPTIKIPTKVRKKRVLKPILPAPELNESIHLELEESVSLNCIFCHKPGVIGCL